MLRVSEVVGSSTHGNFTLIFVVTGPQDMVDPSRSSGVGVDPKGGQNIF